MNKSKIKQLALLGLTNGLLISSPSGAFANEQNAISTLENLKQALIRSFCSGKL